MATNEVKLNGEVILSTRGDTVSENNLMMDETATDRKGEKITGKLEPVDKNDAYLVSDEIGDISDEDYIPFNDVSDVVTPKKKIGVLSFFEKLKSVFLPKETSSSQFSLDLVSQVLQYKSKTIDASKTDNDVSAITYPSTMCILDSAGRIIMRTEAIVNPDGNIGWKSYVRNYNTNGNVVNQKGILYNMDKSGNLVYRIDDENAFRKAIKTIDQVGTRIEVNSDLDDYINAGSYYVKSDTDASDISNVPIARSGKLVVLENDYSDSNTANRLYQMYFTNENHIYFRFKTYEGTFTSWKRLATYDEISPSGGGGSGFAEGTVSGSTISATISGFQLNTGVIVSIVCPSMPTNATLNINNTGAKPIVGFSTNTIRTADFGFGSGGLFTFIYDGTRYRIISVERTPLIGVQNYVADTSGNLVLTTGYDSNAYQLKYRIEDNKLAWNGYKNSVWKGDKILADYDDLFTQKGLEIPANSDFNSYINGGIYYVSDNSIASTINNIPVKSSGKLVVAKQDAGARLYQYYLVGRDIYARTMNNNSNWTSWLKFINSEEVITANNVISTAVTSLDDIPINTSGRIALDSSISPLGTTTTFLYICYGRLDGSNPAERTIELTRYNHSNKNTEEYWKNSYNGTSWTGWLPLSRTGTYVGTCTTASNERIKVVTVDDDFSLKKGVRIAVKYTNNNTYSSSTSSPCQLNVNGTGAKNIWYGANHSGAGNTGTNNYAYGSANRYIYYVYDGTYWVWSGINNEDNTTDPRQLGFGYGTCSTASSTLAKEVTLSDYILRTGGFVCVYFSYGVPANSTLNINGKGAKNIRYKGSNIANNIIRAGDRCLFVYNGGQYDLLGIDKGSTNEEYVLNTSNCTVNSKLTKGAQYVEGHLINQNLLYLRFEMQLSASSSTTISTSEELFSFSGLKLRNAGFSWQDFRGYIGYTELVPLCFQSSSTKLSCKLRKQRTFSTTVETLRFNVVLYVERA